MPAVNPSAFGPKPFFVDAAGNPDLSYKLFMYAAGSTSTKQNSYTNSTGAVANTNPIILNALGQTPNELWWDSSLLYKVVLAPSTDTDPPTNPVWTIDNLAGMNSNNGGQAVAEWILYSGGPTYVSANSFTIAGNQTQTFHIGRRLQLTTVGGMVYGRITNAVFSSVTTITVQMDGAEILDASLSAVYYSILTNDVLALPERIANTSGTNIYTATVGIARLVIGDEYKLNFTNPNDGTVSPTLALDGNAAIAILTQNGSVPVVGAINGAHIIRYNGINFIVLNPNVLQGNVDARQAIQYGPITGTFNTSNLIPQTQINNLVATGVTINPTAVPVFYSVANGYNSDGSQKNINRISSASIVVANLPVSTTGIRIVVDVVTGLGSFVNVTDTDQYGGTIPVTNNQYTFDASNYINYVGNGTTASQTNRLVIAEVDTDATKVIAIRCRPYLAKAQGETAALALSTAYSFNSNIGTKKIKRDAYFEFINTDGGYAVGDQINVISGDSNGSTTFGGPFWTNLNTCGISIGAGSGITLLQVTNKTTFATASLNAPNCKFCWSIVRSY